MPAQPGQDGQCGNFNGIPADDGRMAVLARLGVNGVLEEDLLFPGPKTLVNPAISGCPQDILTNAHESCKQITDHFWPTMACLTHVCNGGTAATAQPGRSHRNLDDKNVQDESKHVEYRDLRDANVFSNPNEQTKKEFDV